ncbi:MAG: hypothetical protein ACOX3T_07485 [Bdellovibrionota bacterium]
MKKNNFISFIFLMLVVAMIALPNFTPNGATKLNIKNQKFLPTTFPWSAERNELSLVNCTNYSPDTYSTINITYNGVNRGKNLERKNLERKNLKRKTTEEISIAPKETKTFFTNELESFNKLNSKKGTISIDSKTDNVCCYINYYTYDDNDNINSVSFFTNSNIIVGNSYFINNKKLFNKKIKSINLYIHNISNENFNANIKSYSKNGRLKKIFELKNLKPNETKVFRLKGKNNITYHILPNKNVDKNSKKVEYIAYIKVFFEDETILIKPTESFDSSNIERLKNTVILSNTSEKKINVSATIYSNFSKYSTKNILLKPYSQKTLNFKKDIKNIKNPYIKFTEPSNSVVAFYKYKGKTFPFTSKESLSSNDIILGYNLSLGERGTLSLTNSEDIEAKVNIHINGEHVKKLTLSPFSQRLVKLNKLLNRKNLIGYIYISSDKKVSAKLNNTIGKKISYTHKGLAIKDRTFSGIEKPEYIIK